MRRLGTLLLLMALLVSAPVYAANTHGVTSEAAERQRWFGDMFQPHVTAGCVPAVPSASLTLPSTACTGYVKATTEELVYVTQAAHTIGPLDAGDGTYWLIVHRNTSAAVEGWTRQAGTHYLWLKSATLPTIPADTLLVADVTVAGGVITAVAPRGGISPSSRAVVFVSKFVPAHGMTFTAIQAAIDALPVTGGTVMIEPGTYTGATSLTLGNGGVGVASTRHGVMLKGMAPVDHDLARAGVILWWTGGAAPVIHVRGPLAGWGLENLYIYGGGTANAGVFVVSGQYGDVKNIVLAGHAGNGIWSTCVPTFVGWNGATDSLKNNWHEVWVWHLPPAAAGTAGIALDSTDVTCNTDFNMFYQATVFVAGVDGWGIWLGGSDHNMFYNAHIGDDATTRSGVHFAYDNAAFSGWPCANNFYGLSLGNEGMTTSGTPHATNFCGNQIFGLTGGDPVDFIPDLAGVSVVSIRRINQNLILIPSRSPGAAEPIGHIEIGTSVAHPRHLVPQLDTLVDLGLRTSTEGAKRFRNLELGGHVMREVRAVAGDTTLNVETDHLLFVGNSGGATTILLGSAVAACNKGPYIVRNTTANAVVLTATLSQAIDGLTTFTLDDNPKAVSLVSDCLNWWISSTHGTH